MGNIKFKAIVCMNIANCIGDNGKLLYSIKNDMENFKRQTLGNIVVMGLNTFKSLPNSSPLKGRTNVIITHDKDFFIETDGGTDAYIVHSIEEAVELCKYLVSVQDKKLFVIGGASIYKQFMDMGLIEELIVTMVEDNHDGDAHFPTINKSEWTLRLKTEKQQAKNRLNDADIAYWLEMYEKK